MQIKGYELRVRNSWIKITAVAAAVVFIVWFFGGIILKSPLSDEAQIIIDEGINVYKISEILKEGGVIKNKLFFVIYVLVTGNESSLQAGRYVFRPGATVPDVVFSLVNGLAESDDVIITIPEGFNVFDIDKWLTDLGLIEKGWFAKEYFTNEGYLFPDTYRLRQLSAQDYIEELGGKMKENFNLKTEKLFGGLNQNQQKEIITIASMLEKEAKNETDMQLIAGIIGKRLEKKILLQIDATVSYGACLRDYRQSTIDNQPFRYCDVSQIGVADEIKTDGPYNTYTRIGLPPGAISNPGLKAIGAALNPQESDYLYYLSTRDGSRIIYSKTALEHTVNRRKYLGI